MITVSLARTHDPIRNDVGHIKLAGEYLGEGELPRRRSEYSTAESTSPEQSEVKQEAPGKAKKQAEGDRVQRTTSGKSAFKPGDKVGVPEVATVLT